MARITAKAKAEYRAQVAARDASRHLEAVEVNQAIASGKEIILETSFGPYVILSVDWTYGYTTYPQGGSRYYTRHFAVAADSAWSKVLETARAR